MNRGELVDAIANEAKVPKKQIERIVESMLTVIQKTVSEGGKVTLVGFGTFEARQRAARGGVNPRTGEAMQIPATRVPAFSAGKAFKESVLP